MHTLPAPSAPPPPPCPPRFGTHARAHTHLPQPARRSRLPCSSGWSGRSACCAPRPTWALALDLWRQRWRRWRRRWRRDSSAATPRACLRCEAHLSSCVYPFVCVCVPVRVLQLGMGVVRAHAHAHAHACACGEWGQRGRGLKESAGIEGSCCGSGAWAVGLKGHWFVDVHAGVHARGVRVWRGGRGLRACAVLPVC